MTAEPPVPAEGRTGEDRCGLCGRTGTRGFRHVPAGMAETSVGPVAYPAQTWCAGKVACRRRMYRSIPPAARAARRIEAEMNA